MSTLDVVQRLFAASDGRYRRRTLYRHRHIAAAPLVVVAYRLAGESAAPLGIMFGTDAATPTLLVAPEPRNREIRFRQVFNPFAEYLVEHLNSLALTTTIEKNRQVCEHAPQIIVPNTATAEFVGPLLGRSLRYLQNDGEYGVPETTTRAGAYLTWLGDRSDYPGSSVMLSATELLRRHWMCGISDLESEELHVQLAWLTPPAGSLGSEAGAAAEAARVAGVIPAAGPTPDPVWDRDVLDALIGEFNRQRERADDADTVARLGSPIRDAVAAALAPAWDATWAAVSLVRELPVAGSVAERWADDRREFSRFAERVETGEARFRTRDSVKQAAFAVSRREDAQSKLDAAESLDDPMVFAGAIADGRAFAGIVTSVTKPTVTLEVNQPCAVPLGTELFWTEQRGKCSVILADASTEAPFTVSLITKKGKTKYFPKVGERAAYGPYTNSVIPSPKMPAVVPWTHEGPRSPMPTAEVPE